MTEANDFSLTHVYVRLNFSGYIPPLDVYGPIRASWVEKEKVKELIRSGYDVELINSSACPEFASQLSEYRKLLAEKDYIGAKAVFTSALDRNPTSAVETALTNAENLVGGPLTENGGTITDNTVDTGVSAPVSNPLGQAVQKSLESVGESSNAGLGEDIVPGTTENSYSDEMANLGSGSSIDGSAGESEFGQVMAPTGEVEPFDSSALDGAVTVTKKTKKGRK